MCIRLLSITSKTIHTAIAYGCIGVFSCLLILISIASISNYVYAQTSTFFDTPARAAYAIDHNTGLVLLEKNANVPLPPASLSKIMTLAVAFDALQAGYITLDTQFTVSEKAKERGGSTMFLRTGERVSVINLLRGIIVHSGNDAAITLAEGIAGSEQAFAILMNQKAATIGLTASSFINASGWPHPEQNMSARDITEVSRYIIATYPQYYPLFAEARFTWDNITQTNRNPLLALDIGADGLKTGHTQAAGYGLAASVKQENRRITFTITGLDTQELRKSEAVRLVQWAMRYFRQHTLFDDKSTLAALPVWRGNKQNVPVTVASPVSALIPITEANDVYSSLTITLDYQSPINAPIAKGQTMGTLTLASNHFPQQNKTFAIVAQNQVERGGFLNRVHFAWRTMVQQINRAF